MAYAQRLAKGLERLGLSGDGKLDLLVDVRAFTLGGRELVTSVDFKKGAGRTSWSMNGA